MYTEYACKADLSRSAAGRTLVSRVISVAPQPDSLMPTTSVLVNNPGLLVVCALALGSAGLIAVLALAMHRAGRSLRPIIFIGGFMAIIVAPQLAFHAAQALGWIPKRDLTWTSASHAAAGFVSFRVDTALLAQRNGRFLDRAAVFGPAHDSSLVTDLRARMPDGPFAQAAAAEMAIVPPTSSITVAVFDAPALASAAGVAYLAQLAGGRPAPGPDGAITVARAFDVLKVVIADRVLIVWSGPDSTAVATALATSRLVQRAAASASTVGSANASEAFWLYRPWTLAMITLMLVVIATLWFFRMSAWAGEVTPDPRVKPVHASDLRQRLLAVNTLDVPFTVTADPSDGTRLIASWRYADAKWIDFVRVHGVRRTHRIVMRLDERAAIVRFYDQSAAVDWSAGFDGASLRWNTERGVVFFQHDWTRVFGLQIDAAGRLTPRLSYTWSFNLQEMKAPLVLATTQAGWRWRPTLLDGPPWLRWLTH